MVVLKRQQASWDFFLSPVVTAFGDINLPKSRRTGKEGAKQKEKIERAISGCWEEGVVADDDV